MRGFITNVCAIVPLYNEEKYVRDTIGSLKKIEKINCIIAVDDGSNDNTWNIISEITDIIKVKHHKNRGKAQSIRDAISISDADIYVFVDGDLGESAKELSPLIERVINDKCDMCIAMPVYSIGGGIGLLRYFSRFIIKKVTKKDFPCPLSGQRAVSNKIIKNKKIKYYSGFGLEVGMLIDTINCGYRVEFVEVNIKHRYTDRSIKGFIHRFKQFIDVCSVYFKISMRW